MTALPPPVHAGLERALRRLGASPVLREIRPVTGGCINHGAKVTAQDGAVYFLKWNASAPPTLFQAEADGLAALAATGALRVPRPLAHGGGSSSPAWLLMEHVPQGAPGRAFDASLGEGLARLHGSALPGARFGWQRPNWIGSLPQSNRTTASWASFWRDQRLLPQLRRAREAGAFGGERAKVLDRVIELTSVALDDADGATPHLLHGDLWHGNTFPGPDGEPVLIDPAVYRGHGEVDLAMTELFGGFGPAFYEAYAAARPIGAAYREYRRDLYQLYYLLVHVNLFGTQYEARTLAAAGRVAAAFAA